MKAYCRMVKKFDAVIWNLYKHLWIFCCSAEYIFGWGDVGIAPYTVAENR